MKYLSKLRHLFIIACCGLYHSHGYTFLIDTWVLLDLAIKTPIVRAVGIEPHH